MKTCKICGQSFPANNSNFYKCKQNRDGLHPYCKPCHNAVNKANRDAKDPDYQKRYYQENKERVLARTGQYYKDNRGKYKVWRKEWRVRNPEKTKAHSVRWHKILWAKPEYRLKHRAYSRNYKARKKAAGCFRAKDIARIYAESNGCCAYCQNPVGTKYHIEHIVPLSRGGTNNPSNLCVACPKCNLSKHNKTPDEWVSRWYLADN